MASVGREPAILFLKRHMNASGHGLLAIIQVAEATDVPRLVFVVARNLHPTHRVHQSVVREEVALHRFLRAILQVVRLRMKIK